MSRSFVSQLAIGALSLSFGLFALAAPASADIGWLVQPQTVIAGGISLDIPATTYFGDPVAAITIRGVPQTDVGTSGNPALPNPVLDSTKASATGFYKSIGNNFLTSLDLGKYVVQNPAGTSGFPLDFSGLTVQATTTGNWLPNQSIAGQTNSPEPTFNFGTAQPANTGAKLLTISPVGSDPMNPADINPYTGLTYGDASKDNGRVAFWGLKFSPSTEVPVEVGPTIANPTQIKGEFNNNLVKNSGLINISINLNVQITDGVADLAPIVVPQDTFIALSLEGHPANNIPSTHSSLSGAAANGWFDRINPATGLSSSGYYMHSPYVDDIGLGGGLTITLTLNGVAKANLVPGDVNFDGIVNILDITTIANPANWLHNDLAAVHPGLLAGDSNGDGKVDILDITMAANPANWLHSSPPLPGGGGGGFAAVPEPSSLLLLGFGVASMLFVTRRRVRR